MTSKTPQRARDIAAFIVIDYLLLRIDRRGNIGSTHRHHHMTSPPWYIFAPLKFGLKR